MQDDKTAWVQLTVRIPSEQTFAAYDSSRQLVAGDPEKAIKVYDTWVFERALKKDPSTRQELMTTLMMHWQCEHCLCCSAQSTPKALALYMRSCQSSFPVLCGFRNVYII